MNKLQFIREKCIDANPEIVELKFGCELYHHNYHKNAKIYEVRATGNGDIVRYDTDKGHSFYSDEVAEGKIGRNGLKEIWIIIGRPITLSDVLLAMGKTNNEQRVSMRTDGTIVFVNVITEQTENCRWNLKETFENQSKETISFIYGILK